MSLRRIGDITAGVVARFPFEQTVEPLPNDPRMEWLFSAIDGRPPANQKRLILQSRNPEVAFLDDGQADQMLDALGIRGV